MGLLVYGFMGIWVYGYMGLWVYGASKRVAISSDVSSGTMPPAAANASGVSSGTWGILCFRASDF